MSTRCTHTALGSREYLGVYRRCYKRVVFKLISRIYWTFPVKLPLNKCRKTSLMIQLIAFCRQKTNHYLNQGWPISMTRHGVTRPQNNSPVSQWYSPSGEQPASYIITLRNLWGHVATMPKITQCGYLERELKDIVFYVKKKTKKKTYST